MSAHTHLAPQWAVDADVDAEPYTHDHEGEECTHHWASCPVHTPAEGLPTPQVATTCIYGGAELEGGGTWDMDTSKALWNRVADRLLS